MKKFFHLSVLFILPTNGMIKDTNSALPQKKSTHLESYLETPLARAKQLANKILEKTKNLKEILSDYQTHNVSCYEIERSTRTLNNLCENSAFLDTHERIESAAVMLPSNLPLYSLIVFAIIPSFLSNHVNIRPNSLLQENNIISRIYDELELDIFAPQVNIINMDHAGFKPYLKDANLIIFTGKPSNATTIIQDMKEGSVLALNGSGHNPVVVTKSADIKNAVEGALLLKGFNGGQDCAGPDAILVQHDIATEFIDQFTKKFAALKTGSFKDPTTQVGPIQRLNELQKFATLFHTNSKDIVLGGVIDFRNSIVSPTTIVRGIERDPNFKEVFGPVAFIHPYKHDQDLAYYFQDINGLYNANRMYVTVYGQSKFLSSKDDSIDPNNSGNVGILLHNQTIHDVEIGYKPYGGYSLGASALIKKTSNGIQKVAMPILLPEIIFKYIIKGENLSTELSCKQKTILSSPSPTIIRDKQIDPIIKEFQGITQAIFGKNLVFAFVFGSAAKGKLQVKGPGADDLDTFICLKELKEASCQEYLKQIAALHHKQNLKIDERFPAEIITLDALEKTIETAGTITPSIDRLVIGHEFDQIFWVHALTDKKIGFIGDGKILSQMIKNGRPHITRWADQILDQLKKKEELPKYLNQTFSGLSKQEIIEKLSKYSPHLVVHLGLNYDDGK